MPTALIADDEPHLANHLKEQLLALWPELHIVHMAANGTEAASAIAQLNPDIAFLDIQMPGLTGLEVAQGIEGNTRVVFVTAYDAYAVQAFDEAAIDYLLKPLRRERLAQALERVKTALAPALDNGSLAQTMQRLLQAQLTQAVPPQPAPRLHYIRASQGAMTHQVPVADVLYFQSDEKYTVVRARDGEHLIRTPIAELAAQLDPERFMQIHRSTLVNQDYVEGVRRDDNSRMFVRMRGVDGELAVSRAYVHLFRAM
ncbi:LytR/AlgR family response regulator transcription factor [Pseudoduganella ginsengisoli]|uniref:Response regulator n=1 Tax=Pseudoduganella ginsengisoli TaxID=1462440 RepID=A0A6L6Q4C5_9BURK|nr:LytTR family DNA-binding domain-containing protein [Pseudoduganella ginsengisoli]MTW04068.1 response regulator [Pseudoduganella ginsengisoli]